MTLKTTMMLGGTLLLAAATAAPARAQLAGPYIGAGAGANFRQESDLTLKGPGADTARAMGLGTTGKLGFSGAGPVTVGSLGWGFGRGFRAEVEFNYRSNDVGSVSAAGIPGSPRLTGSASTYAFMANALYDVQGLGWRLGVPVTPYVGLGGGYAWSAYNRIMLRSGNDGSMTYGVDGRFAYQGILGLAWDLSSLARGLSLTTEYRYFGVVDPQVLHGAKVGRTSYRDAKIETTNHNHALVVGLRYAFWGPAPRPAGL
jgi:OOP family OmpA-OmpF porin